jgi:signal transduction histidine kinase
VHELQATQKATTRWTLSLVVGALFLGFVFLVLLRRQWISAPVLAATHMARKIAPDQPTETLSVSSHSEIGDLRASLNVMQQHLRESREGLIRTNTDLIAGRDGALAASAAKSRFLGNVSHELLTSLNSVMGMSTLLIDSRLDDESREIAAFILTSGQSLAKLINGVWDFSKLEVERFELEASSFELESLFKEVISTAAAGRGSSPVTIGYFVDPRVPRSMIGDAGRMQ